VQELTSLDDPLLSRDDVQLPWYGVQGYRKRTTALAIRQIRRMLVEGGDDCGLAPADAPSNCPRRPLLMRRGTYNGVGEFVVGEAV